MTEKEVSYKILRFDKLLSFLKDISRNVYKTNNITFQYFESDLVPHFYARLENIVDLDTKSEKKLLTFKYGFKTVGGVNIRKEKTTHISDPKFYIELFKFLGLKRKGSKHKLQYRFNIAKVDITVNKWKEMSPRIEVEANSVKNIKYFVNQIKDFVELENK